MTCLTSISRSSHFSQVFHPLPVFMQTLGTLSSVKLKYFTERKACNWKTYSALLLSGRMCTPSFQLLCAFLLIPHKLRLLCQPPAWGFSLLSWFIYFPVLKRWFWLTGSLSQVGLFSYMLLNPSPALGKITRFWTVAVKCTDQKIPFFSCTLHVSARDKIRYRQIGRERKLWANVFIKHSFCLWNVNPFRERQNLWGILIH